MIERTKNVLATVVALLFLAPIMIYNRTHFYGRRTLFAEIGPSWWQSLVVGSEWVAYALLGIVLVGLALERVRG